MSNPKTRSNVAGAPQPDAGSALTMVLAFIVVSSLIVIPMLNYAITVLRVNSISVEKREDLETVRGGARVAIADPVHLFTNCTSQTVPFDLTTPAVDAETSCLQLEEIGVTSALDIPHAAVAMQVGEQITGYPFDGLSFNEPPAAAAANWWDVAGVYEVDPVLNTIWLPQLPERESTVQNPDGHALPAPYNCQVYFPGTYEAPIVVDTPTYFASGVYYFEESVTVVGGADAVAGFGLAEGCVGDLQAVLDLPAANAPARFNIDGLGATWIFGEASQLIIDDTKALDGGGNIVPNAANQPIRFEINQRYLRSADEGGARVSIMSVNGATDPITSIVGPLDVTGVIHMPESEVRIGGNPVPASASSKGFVPSTLTAQPRQPAPPTITSIIALAEPTGHGLIGNKDGAAHISWAAPIGNEEGGSTITEYRVFDGGGNLKCQTAGARECVAMDLPKINWNVTTAFTVVATNAIGTSDPSAPSSVTITNSAPNIVAPASPANVVVESAAAAPAAAPDSASISWDAPTFTGYVPVISYEVKAYRVHTGLLPGSEVREDLGRSCSTTYFRDQLVPTTCIIDNLVPLDTNPGMGPELTPAVPAVPPALPIPAVNADWLGYEFEVTATNPIYDTDFPTPPPQLLTSTPSVPSNRLAMFDGSGTAVVAGPPVMPVAPTYVPDPILDIDVSGAAVSEVKIAGYVSAPQGRIGIVNPTTDEVEVVGGVVAGSYGIDPSTFGASTKVGFLNTVLQRKIAVTTTLTSGSNRSSIMIVQINANGADMKVNAWITQ